MLTVPKNIIVFVPFSRNPTESSLALEVSDSSNELSGSSSQPGREGGVDTVQCAAQMVCVYSCKAIKGLQEL